jgi:transposase-like protein
MMTVMTAQPPLPLAPANAVPVGAAAGLVEDAEGGRVWLHGNLWLAWDVGDEVTRRLAATQLVATKAATATAVAQAFGVNRETLRRWGTALAQAGAVGLVSDPRGPKGPSRLTADVVADIRARRAERDSLRTIAEATEVSVTSVRRALAEEAEPAEEPGVDEPADAGADVEDGQDTDKDEDEAGDDGGDDGGRAGLPVLADPDGRTAERGLARWGLLEQADPVFIGAARVPLAGLLFAVPGLEATGLLRCARATYGALPNGFYGLDTVLVESVLRTLAGEPRAEGATRTDPVALGRVLGLDRAPEVKTIRRKFGLLAAAGKTDQLLAAMARHHLKQATEGDPELAAVLYVDGHTRVYGGKRRIAKTHVARMKFPAPATVETWVADSAGDPVLVVMADPGASLAGELRRLLPDLRAAVGDDRRVLVGFDRGGWSPRLFKDMAAAGFDVLTWRKGAATDIDDNLFAEVTYRDTQGRVHTWESAETTVEIPLDDKHDGKQKTKQQAKQRETFAMRQVTRREGPGARQVHILTTADSARLSIGEVNFRMGSRWRQENSFRYGRMHFDLDSHDSYRHSEDDPGRSVPNPAKKQTRNAVAAARARYEREAARADAALLELRSPTAGQVVISNADHNRATADLRAAEADLNTAEQANRATPARLPLGEVNPGQQILETETKLLTHAVKIAAFNTSTALARDLRIHTGYARAGDEAHALIRQVLTHTGDIDPDPDAGTLTVRLDPMPTPRATRAVAELCEHLTHTQTRYPGTNLVLRYGIKTRR